MKKRLSRRKAPLRERSEEVILADGSDRGSRNVTDFLERVSGRRRMRDGGRGGPRPRSPYAGVGVVGTAADNGGRGDVVSVVPKNPITSVPAKCHPFHFTPVHPTADHATRLILQRTPLSCPIHFHILSSLTLHTMQIHSSPMIYPFLSVGDIFTIHRSHFRIQCAQAPI